MFTVCSNTLPNVVEAGAFGEVGFVQPDSKRTASVVADEQCFLLRIERADYSRSLLACAAVHFLRSNSAKKYSIYLTDSFENYSQAFFNSFTTAEVPAVRIQAARCSTARIAIFQELSAGARVVRAEQPSPAECGSA